MRKNVGEGKKLREDGMSIMQVRDGEKVSHLLLFLLLLQRMLVRVELRERERGRKRGRRRSKSDVSQENVFRVKFCD